MFKDRNSQDIQVVVELRPELANAHAPCAFSRHEVGPEAMVVGLPFTNIYASYLISCAIDTMNRT